MIILIVSIHLVAAVGALALLIRAHKKAPIGYQDKDGFHHSECPLKNCPNKF